MKCVTLRWVLVAATLATPAAAQKKQARSHALETLVACREITDPAQRLVCYDREVAAFDAAAKSDKVVVLDQEQVKATRRTLFGFALPSLKIFGDHGGADDELKRIETQVRTIERLSDGRVSFSVEDGARWVQTDDRTLSLARIKAGTVVQIDKAAFGSYFASFKGSSSIKVRRER